MKRIFCILVAVCLTMGLCACKDKDAQSAKELEATAKQASENG